MSASLHPDIAVDARATLGEGPVWDAEQQWLVWLDILPGLHAGAVFAADVGARGLPALRFAG